MSKWLTPCALCFLIALPLTANDIEVDGKLVSRATTGAPLEVSSTTRVDNLNADQLDGKDATEFATVDALVNEIALLQAQLDEANARLGISQKTVFVTSTTYNGNLGDIAGALVECNERARTAGLIGFYRPWLATSSSENPANSMTRATVPYVRTDGAVVADNWADLTDGTLSNPIDHDEFGNDLSATVLLASAVWSNVRPDGTTLFSPPDFHCNFWSTATTDFNLFRGMIGLFVSTESVYWTASKTNDPDGPGFDFIPCANPARLYCFQQ
jgi:hypothetical protein